VRSAARLSRTPGAYRDLQARERRRALRQVLAMLRRARESDAEWYLWALANAEARTQERREAGLRAAREILELFE
jgi:hypothetical protein